MDKASEKVAAGMALAVQKWSRGLSRRGLAGASFGSAARHKQWPTACLGRKRVEIGSMGLAGQRIFHIGSATKGKVPTRYPKARRNTAQTVP
jgi:hypothetical protein